MTDPNRLLTETTSPLGAELLRAVTHEQLPSELRVRMLQNLASTGVLGAPPPSHFPGPGARSDAAHPELGNSAGQPSVAAPSLKAALGTKAITATVIAGCVAGAAYLLSAVNLRVPTDAAHSDAPAISDVTPTAVPAPQPGTAPGAQPGAKRAHSVTAKLTAPIEEKAIAKTPTLVRRIAPKAAAPGVALEPGQPQSRNLDAELRLLDSARSAIVAGKLAAARSTLAEYQRRFPDGALNREAATLLGRISSAE